MANPKCNLPEEERERVLDGVPRWLTGEEEDTAASLFPQYLFYDNVGDRQVFCTACRERFSVSPKERGKHGTDGTCPHCGRKATWAVVGKYSYKMSTLESWIKTAIAYPADNGGLYIIAGEVRRSFSWENLAGEIDWKPWKIYYFRRGAVMMASIGRVYNCWDFSKSEDLAVFEERVKEPFAPNKMNWADYDGEYNIIGLESALAASDFKYCQILPFYYYQFGARLEELATAKYMMKYLAWYALHPQIEMAVKFGLSDAVEELIVAGKENKRLLDWNAADPAGFLRMNKQEAKSFLNSGLGFAELKLWRTCGKGIRLEQFMDIVANVGAPNMPKLTECAKSAGVKLPAAAKYALNVKKLSVTRRITTWKDYLDMAGKLGYDLKEMTVAMPKDLDARHDAAAAALEYQEDKIMAEKYKTRYKRLLKCYEFELNGLRIVIPKTEREIINEGKTLHHCVGGYAARHMEGKSTILFLRKARTPGRSFLTIELAKNKKKQVYIMQIHGYRNDRYRAAVRPEDKYSWFLKPWLDWVNSGSKRDKDGKPIIENKEATA